MDVFTARLWRQYPARNGACLEVVAAHAHATPVLVPPTETRRKYVPIGSGANFLFAKAYVGRTGPALVFLAKL